jgi:hypothetical protein
LLGIAPGTGDPAQIESHVFERMETVRRYQLQDPELATEAMNRLAQAFVCLTNPESKRTYDAQFLVPPPPRRRVSSPALPVPPPLPEEVKLPDDLKLEEIGGHSDSDPLAWMYGASPQEENQAPQEPTAAVEELPSQVTPESPTTIIDALDTLTELASLPVKNRQEKRSPSFENIEGPPFKHDPIVEAARSSEAAKRGLHTKRSLYHRIAKTRELLRAWNEAGEYIGDPERRLTKPVEATELIYLLGTIRSHLKKFPPLLGKAGQPGYLVVALAKQQVIVPTYQTLLPSQRETLARDWVAGQKLLAAHRDFLRVELRLMRRRSLPARVMRVTRHFVGAHPGMILLILAMIALGVAMWRTVYLGAMTKSLESFKIAKKEERTASPAPTRPLAKPESRTKKSEPGKIAPSPEAPKTSEQLPEPVKKDEGMDAPPGPPDLEEKPTESASQSKEVGDKTKLRVLIPPFRGGDEKTGLYGVRGLAFVSIKDAANPQFFSCNRDFVTLWEINDNRTKCERINEKKFAGNLNCLTGCSKTDSIAFGCEDGTVHVCKANQTPAEATILKSVKHKYGVTCLAFSHLGKWLATAGQDGQVNLLDMKSEALTGMQNKAGSAQNLAFIESGDSRWPLLVSGHADGSLCLWRVNSPFALRVAQAHEGEINCLASSPDGKIVVSGGHDGVVQTWRLAKVFGKIVGLERVSSPISPHRLDRPVRFLAFSVDSRYLLAAFDDMALEISDLHSNKKVVENFRCQDLVSNALFSPDGKGLLIGHSNGTMVYYALPKQLYASLHQTK